MRERLFNEGGQVGGTEYPSRRGEILVQVAHNIGRSILAVGAPVPSYPGNEGFVACAVLDMALRAQDIQDTVVVDVLDLRAEECVLAQHQGGYPISSAMHHPHELLSFGVGEIEVKGDRQLTVLIEPPHSHVTKNGTRAGGHISEKGWPPVGNVKDLHAEARRQRLLVNRAGYVGKHLERPASLAVTHREEADLLYAVLVEIDLNQDGVQEVCLFTVRDGEGSRSLEVLSDISRTVDKETLSAGFGVEIFDVADGRPTLLRDVAAGTSPVLRDVGVRRLNQDGELPVAFYFDFADSKGQQLVWVVHGGGDRVSTLVLRKDALFGTKVKDIDNDGILDVLRSERHIEDGTGYETFITWIRWNGRSYSEYRTTNIVRNLNEYLATAGRILGSSNLTAFVEKALSQRTLESLRAEGLDALMIVNRILQPSSSSLQSFGELLRRDGKVEAAEFPRFFENPFSDPGATLTIPVRIVCCGGLSAVFETRLAMAENPFSSPQFFFIPGKR